MFSKSSRIVRALAQCEPINLSPLKCFSSIKSEGCGFSGDGDKTGTPILRAKWDAGSKSVAQWRTFASATEVC